MSKAMTENKQNQIKRDSYGQIKGNTKKPVPIIRSSGPKKPPGPRATAK